MDVAVIGAGLAGLSCTRALVAAGLHVEVFDKGRGPGGRVATRRSDFGAFDHGAAVLHGLPADMIATYQECLSSVPGGVVAHPRMSSLPRAMEAGVTVHHGTRLTALQRRADKWSLAMENARGTVSADKVALCIPAPQALELLPGGVFAEISRVQMSPIWTLMLAYDGPLDMRSDLLETEIFTAIHQSSRPGREPVPERWVVHGAQGWSRANVDADPASVEAELLAAFGQVATGAEITHRALHRWLYGRVRTPAGKACFWTDERAIGAAGDWCLGPNGGHAVESGQALAREILK